MRVRMKSQTAQRRLHPQRMAKAVARTAAENDSVKRRTLKSKKTRRMESSPAGT